MTKKSTQIAEWAVDELFRAFPAVETDFENNDPFRCSKLERYFGPALFERIHGKCLVDFGCGRGADAVFAALHGANVFGIDTHVPFIATSRALAAKHGVGNCCTFIHPELDRRQYRGLYESCDYVVTIDSFEHFPDPYREAVEMCRLVRPGGKVLIAFGPPWRHPYGAHMTHFTRFPWAHLIFTEQAVLSSAARAGIDIGAGRYEETIAHPNRMTIARFERILTQLPAELMNYRCVPIRNLRLLAESAPTREFFTSLVLCELQKPG